MHTTLNSGGHSVLVVTLLNDAYQGDQCNYRHDQFLRQQWLTYACYRSFNLCL